MHKQVMTVTGPAPAGKLGIILPHEHVFINLVNQFHEPSMDGIVMFVVTTLAMNTGDPLLSIGA